jgi:hypothetical protein
VANIAFADDKNCAHAEQLLKDIDNEAGLFYSPGTYAFKNDVLDADLKALAASIKLPVLDTALTQFAVAIADNKGFDLALADVAMAIHEWESDKCF